MYYTEQFNKLLDAVKGLPPQSLAGLSESNLVFLIEGICGPLELTMGEIGAICELVRQIITKERAPKDLEVGLVEKLDEDNREKTPAIVSQLSEKLFSKLLPALGIKVPIEFAVRVAPPKPELPKTTTPVPTESDPAPKVTPPPAPIRPTESAPLQRMPLPPVSATPPPARLTPHQTYQGSTLINPKPPVMETSHESMSRNPLDSLMQMLEGKVSPKDLSRQYERLPESLKNALGSVDSAKKIVDIGRKYALHMDKLGELGAETGMVILGFTHPAQFLSRLTKRLGLSEEKVRPIAQEINTEVFLKIREALKMLHGEGEERSTPTPTETIPAKPQEPPTEQQPEKSSTETGYQNLTSMNSTASPIPMKPEGNLMVSETEEVLDREAILRDIENPTPTVRVELGIKNQESGMGRETMDSGMKPTPPESKNIPIKPRGPAQPAATGTTGIPPRAVPTSGQTPKKIPAGTSFIPSLKKEVTAPLASRPLVPTIPVPGKTPAQTAALPPVSPPLTPKPEVLPNKPQNIVDQKLSMATSSTKSEGKYAADPYRETIG